MIPKWSVHNEIQKHAQRESDYRWAITTRAPKTPKVESTRVKMTLSAGIANFIKSSVYELRP